MIYLKDNQIVTTLPETIVTIEETIIDDEHTEVSEITINFSDASISQKQYAGYIEVSDIPDHSDFETPVWNGFEWKIKESESAKLRTEMWNRIRSIRNNLLVGTDEIADEYINNNVEIPQDVKDARQSLRDFPQVYETGEIDDWVGKVLMIKNFPIPGTTSSEDYNEG